MVFKKKMIAVAAAFACVLQSAAATGNAADSMKYEAEDAKITGTLESMSESSASGGKVVGKFSESGDELAFNVDIPTSGTYDLVFNSMGYGGDKTNKVSIDGAAVGTFVTKADEYNDAVMSRVILSAGKHEITIKKSWGWIAVDYLEVRPAESISDSVYQVSSALCDPDAVPEAKALFSYICEGYGKQVLSGQVADDGLDSNEFKAIYEVTGKKPAILGLDMMRYTPSRNAFGDPNFKAVERAVAFHKENGIVTFCWHWNSPGDYLKSGNDEENGNPRWWGGFYTRNTTIDLGAIMSGKDEKGKAAIDADIAGIAKQLLRLQDEGVPVLWRPLHEASGGWFWWGAKGAGPYKELYKYLYDQLTNKYGCHNLIWVWNGQNPDWYPGDEYVDVIGEDLYLDKHSRSASASKFAEILEYSGGRKMIALTENGVVFDIDNVIAAGTKWAWFGTWNGSFITNNGKFSDEYTEREVLDKTYNSEYVITLDELPDWSTYKPKNNDVPKVTSPSSTSKTTSTTTVTTTAPRVTTTTESDPDKSFAEISPSGKNVKIVLPEASDTVYLRVDLPENCTYANGGLGVSIPVDGNYYWANVKWEAKKSGDIELNLADSLDGVSLEDEKVTDEDIIAAVKEALVKKTEFQGQIWYAANGSEALESKDGVYISAAYIKKSDSAGTTSSTENKDIVYGDANCDGKVNISDAVLIMQTISNPSMYKLTEQGSANADCSGKNDGVTNSDALAIQKFMLRLIDKLPEA